MKIVVVIVAVLLCAFIAIADDKGTNSYFFHIHSRFPITRFPVTRPPFYERVTVLHNEQTIDPSSTTTSE